MPIKHVSDLTVDELFKRKLEVENEIDMLQVVIRQIIEELAIRNARGEL